VNVDRAEFCALPPAIALGLIYDVASAKLREMPVPPIPRPPKYDDRFPKKKGFFVWCSELDLNSLEWWRGKKAESVASGSEWAEKDEKWVAKLDKWIEWRRLFPYEPWSGTRGEDRASAAPPSREPALHPWGDRPASGGQRQQSKPQTSPENDGRESDEEFQF
jgi:hypothetical protein